MIRLFTALSVAAILLASPARAQTAADAATDGDLRCAMVGLSVAGAAGANAEAQQAGAMLTLYYLGRIQGRAPDFDFENAIISRATSMSVSDLDGDRARCGRELASLGSALTQMGQHMRQQREGDAPQGDAGKWLSAPRTRRHSAAF